MENLNTQPQKQAYHTPELRLYGNISLLTAAVGNAGTLTDGGTMGTQKTA